MTTDASPMGLFERLLSVWVGLGIIAGIALGAIFPALFQSIARLEYASVNLVVAVLIWLMIYPMMVNVDFASLKDVGRRPKGLCITLVVNWLIKPFTMAALGVLFFEVVFAGLVEPATAREYIAGMILLGVAPCTAMVFVWSQLVRGDANYTLVQVSINDIIMVFAFAPLAAFLLGITDVVVPWQTLILSVILYVVTPLAAGYLTRRILDSKIKALAIGRFHRANQTVFHHGSHRNRCVAVWLSGPEDSWPARNYRSHRDTANHPKLWDIRHRLRLGLRVAGAVRDSRACCSNWHLQLF